MPKNIPPNSSHIDQWMWGPVSPSRGSCKQPRSSCVPPPTYHHQRPESHKQSPSYSGYKDAYLESLLKTVSTRGCIFTLDAFKMGWDKLLGIGFSTALKIVHRRPQRVKSTSGHWLHLFVFLHCTFSCDPSNCLHLKRQSYIGHTSLTFLHCAV